MIVHDIASQLGVDDRDLWRLAREGYYRHARLPKRTLSIPNSKLCEVQSLLAKRLSKRLAVHDAAHGSVHGRSVLTMAAVHGAPGVLVGLDLHNFFGCVTQRMLRRPLEDSGVELRDRNFIFKACFEDGVLPQGAPTSPVLANAAVYYMDEELTALCGQRWRYSRFVDDIFFSHPDDVSRREVAALLAQARHIVGAYGFKFAPGKRHIARRHQQQLVVGILVGGGKLRLPREMHRKIRAVLHARAKGWKSTWTDAQLNGYIAFVQMVEPERAASYRAQLEERR